MGWFNTEELPRRHFGGMCARRENTGLYAFEVPQSGELRRIIWDEKEAQCTLGGGEKASALAGFFHII